MKIQKCFCCQEKLTDDNFHWENGDKRDIKYSKLEDIYYEKGYDGFEMWKTNLTFEAFEFVSNICDYCYENFY